MRPCSCCCQAWLVCVKKERAVQVKQVGSSQHWQYWLTKNWCTNIKTECLSEDLMRSVVLFLQFESFFLFHNNLCAESDTDWIFLKMYLVICWRGARYMTEFNPIFGCLEQHEIKTNWAESNCINLNEAFVFFKGVYKQFLFHVLHIRTEYL